MSKLQKLLEEASHEPKKKLLKWIDELDYEDREAILSYAASASLSTRKLHEILVSQGVAISREDLAKWRKDLGLK